MSTKEQIIEALNTVNDAFCESDIADLGPDDGDIDNILLPKLLDMAMQQLKQSHDIEIEKLRAELRSNEPASQSQRQYIIDIVTGNKGLYLAEDKQEYFSGIMKEKKADTVKDLVYRLNKSEASEILNNIAPQKKGK